MGVEFCIDKKEMASYATKIAEKLRQEGLLTHDDLDEDDQVIDDKDLIRPNVIILEERIRQKVKTEVIVLDSDDDDTVQGGGEGGWPLSQFLEQQKQVRLQLTHIQSFCSQKCFLLNKGSLFAIQADQCFLPACPVPSALPPTKKKCLLATFLVQLNS